MSARTTSLLIACLAASLALPASAGGADAAYEILVKYDSALGMAWSGPAGFSCFLGGVPAPEVEVRCTPTFAATKCGDPTAKSATLGLLAKLTVRSICTAGTQADCTASTPDLNPASWWTAPIISSQCSATKVGTAGLPFVCHVVPSGIVAAYEASCEASVA